jgi:hypothetical protein
MLSYEVLAAMKEWDIEVNQEMAYLIRSGVPPHDAASRASEIVTERRREKQRAAKSEG